MCVLFSEEIEEFVGRIIKGLQTLVGEIISSDPRCVLSLLMEIIKEDTFCFSPRLEFCYDVYLMMRIERTKIKCYGVVVHLLTLMFITL